MKPKQDHGLKTQGCLDRPRECSLEGLHPPEIVGRVENPVLEAVRRLWWRAFDRVCYWMVLIRLSVQDRIYGPEPRYPPTWSTKPITRGRPHDVPDVANIVNRSRAPSRDFKEGSVGSKRSAYLGA
jgi:hypothetical protein